MFAIPRTHFFLFTCALLLILALRIVLGQLAQAAEPLLDINSATPALLAERLPGIGPAKAKAIVVYREQHGPFNSIDLLIEVKGIGPATLEKIRPFVYIGVVTPDSAGENNDKSQSEGKAKSNGAASDANMSVPMERTQVQKDITARNAVRAVINIARRKGP